MGRIASGRVDGELEACHEWGGPLQDPAAAIGGILCILGPPGPGSDHVKCLYSGRKNFRMRQFVKGFGDDRK
jgi:hypothetical protein